MNKPDRTTVTPARPVDLHRVKTGALVIIAFAVVLFLLVQALVHANFIGDRNHLV